MSFSMAVTSLEAYEEHQKLIHSIYSSRLKIQILLTLLTEHPSLSRLREITGSTSQALIPKIRSLEKQMLLQSKNYEYVLTPLGKIVADSVAGFVNLMAGIDRHHVFWTTHDLSGIPMEFLARVGELQDSEVELDTQVEVLHVYSHFLKIVREGTYIHGISSIMSPGVAENVALRIFEGVPVELVVNDDVAAMLCREPYFTQVAQIANFENFKVYVIKGELKIGVTVTDKQLSLGLYRNDNPIYDSSTDLSSYDPQAIAWGEGVFRYYRDRSTVLDLKTTFSRK